MVVAREQPRPRSSTALKGRVSEGTHQVPHRGTGHGIWYKIDPTDDPDAVFVTHPDDIPECWEDEMHIQVLKRIGPFTAEYPPQAGCERTVQLIFRARIN